MWSKDWMRTVVLSGAACFGSPGRHIPQEARAQFLMERQEDESAGQGDDKTDPPALDPDRPTRDDLASEIDTKVNRVRALLELRGYDAILLTRRANVSWVSAGVVPGGSVVITRDGRKFILARVGDAPVAASEQLAAVGFVTKVTLWTSGAESTVRALAGGERVASDSTRSGFERLDISSLRWPATDFEIAKRLQ